MNSRKFILLSNCIVGYPYKFRPLGISWTIPGPVIPVRVRQAVPAIQVAGASVRPIPEVTRPSYITSPPACS